MLFELAHIKRLIFWNTDKFRLNKTRDYPQNFIFNPIPRVKLHYLRHASALWWTLRNKFLYFDSVIIFYFWEGTLLLYNLFSHFNRIEIQQLIKLNNNRRGHLYTVFYSLNFSCFKDKLVLFFFQNVILSIRDFIV